MSSIPPFVRQGSSTSANNSSLKSPKPSFRERYQLDSPTLSPNKTPNGAEGFVTTSPFSSSSTTNLNNYNNNITASSSKARAMALQEVLLSRREVNSSPDQRKVGVGPFSGNDFENKSSSIEQFNGNEDEGKNEEKSSIDEDPVQAHLDRIMNRRKERAMVVTIPSEPTQPLMDTPKREQYTNDNLQAIFERRKYREENPQIEIDFNSQDSSSEEDRSDDNSPEVGDIMNEFLKRSVESSRENSPIPQFSPPKVAATTATVTDSVSKRLPPPSESTPSPAKLAEPVRDYPPQSTIGSSSSRTVEALKATATVEQPEKKEATPTKFVDHLRDSPFRGSPKMLRFKDEDEISRPIEALPHNVSTWRITGDRWKLYNISSYLSKESMELLSNRNHDNDGCLFSNADTDTDQVESYNYHLSKSTSIIPTNPYDPNRQTSGGTSSNQSQPRIIKFKNLDDLYQMSFEVPTENGQGKRSAFRAEVSGNFLRCLKNHQIFNQFLSIEDDVLNRMIAGREVLKNTPKGKFHKRFLFIDPKNKELVWSENEKKKTSLARSSRRIKLAEITEIKALELTVDQGRAMKISVPQDKKVFGMVIHSRSRTAEFIAPENVSQFFATVVAIALAAHKYGSAAI